MTHLKIRRADKKDMHSVAKFIRSSADWYRPFLAEDDLKEHYVDKTWIDENYQKRDFYIGINPMEEKVGTISMQYFGDTTYLGYIYLDTQHVGKGHGRQLIDHARIISESKNQDEMVLIAHPKAKWATKAYEKYGFEKVETQKEKILKYKNGFLKPYYEEGFHLYRFNL